jgi:two-component system sensor histidine kinase PilS (NtrC family)
MVTRLEALENIVTQPPVQQDSAQELHWRSLRLYLLYRAILALILMFFFYVGGGPAFLGASVPELYGIVIAAYTAFAFISVLFIFARSYKPEHQAYFALFIDISAITLLTHASGGVQTGMGMLIAVSIIAGALIMGGRASLLFAAIAALAVITDQIYASLTGSLEPQFIQAGFLGTVFFATALLTLVLSGRVSASEQLALKKADELDHLAKINEYVIQHMRTGVLVINASGNILMINNPAWHLLGMPTVTTGNMLSKASPELAHMLRKRRSGKRRSYNIFRAHKQGPELRANFNPIGDQQQGDMLIFLEDTSQITHEAQQMKLASLGRLTASIAHEIRNPLGAISHASQLFDESPDLNAADRRLTEIIKTNATRVNQVIENVLQLSRRDPGKPEAIQLKSWLEKFSTEMIKHQGFKKQEIHIHIEPSDTEIVADPEQLRQILTNLSNNAREHGKEKNKLRLQILGGMTRDYHYPILDIVDNGPGIAPETAKQIFEPFFTTRSNGTGLGLYIAKELSETNNIRLEHIPGPTGGCCFRLHFDRRQSGNRLS